MWGEDVWTFYFLKAQRVYKRTEFDIWNSRECVRLDRDDRRTTSSCSFFLGNKKQKKKAEPGENETFKKEIERLRFDWTDVSCRRSEKYKKNAFDSFVCFHLEFVNNGKAKEKGMANRKQQ